MLLISTIDLIFLLLLCFCSGYGLFILAKHRATSKSTQLKAKLRILKKNNLKRTRKVNNVNDLHDISSHNGLKNEKDTIENSADIDEIPSYKFDQLQDIFICNTCSAEFQSEKEASIHVDMHVEKLQCIECTETFKTYYDLGVHCSKHDEDGKAHCPFCLYKASKFQNLKIHLNTQHLNKFLFYCKISGCGKGFNQVVRLVEHRHTHTGERPHRCVVCNKGFTSDRHLIRHQITCHQVGIEGQKNTCTYCYIYFYKPSTLEKHEKKCASKKHVKKDKNYLCVYCGRAFRHQNELNEHVRSHTGELPFVCTQCGKRFRKKLHLTHHERIHTGEKPYACEYCGKRFARATGLRYHKRTHTGERPYVCILCTKGFTTNQALQIHQKSCGTHTRDESIQYPFVCSECGKGFNKRDYLKVHERVHSGEKPYSCEFCGRKFSQPTPLTVHKRTHTGERPYVCVVCNKGFITNHALKLHKKHCSDVQMSNV